MYRVTKALNHNAVLAIMDKSSREYLLLGKGIGFGRKVSEYIEPTEDCRIYSLSSDSERGSARELLREIEPKYLEIADAILDSAKQDFERLTGAYYSHLRIILRSRQEGSGTESRSAIR